MWYPDDSSEADRLGKENKTLKAEIDRLKERLLTAAGDDLCRLSQEEIKAMTSGAVPIPPKAEFLASCERFHAQVAGEAGVNNNCLTLAQLVAENETMTTEIDRLKEEIKELKSLLKKKDEVIEQHIKGKERVMVKNG